MKKGWFHRTYKTNVGKILKERKSTVLVILNKNFFLQKYTLVVFYGKSSRLQNFWLPTYIL